MYISVIVEIPNGGGKRLRTDINGNPKIEKYPDSIQYPCLEDFAYGYIAGTYNTADNAALDTFILGAEGLDVGEKFECKVLGVRVRNDGDHKLVAVKSDHPLAKVGKFSDLPEKLYKSLNERVNINGFPGEYWCDAEKAKEFIIKYNNVVEFSKKRKSHSSD